MADDVTAQTEFPFPSLDFPGRNTVSLPEIAVKLGCSENHLVNLAEAGELNVLDIGRQLRGRGTYRVPLEEYHRFIYERMSRPASENPILTLSTEALTAHLRDVAARLELRGENPITLLQSHEIDH